MKTTQLGRTGLEVSELGFGGIPILRLESGQAERILGKAFDLGITLYDTAHLYGDSEGKIGRALHGVRDQVVLASKTMKRDAAGAAEQLHNSLRELQTEWIDVFQCHQVSAESEWKEISGPSGALEALSKARDKGQVRFLGVSSHSQEMAVKLVQTGMFDTVQFPFNIIENEPREALFPAARDRGMGILAMKPFAGGVIDDARLAFAFLRQEPGIIPIPGFDSEAAVEEVVGLFERDNEVTNDDLRQMEELRNRLGNRFCRRCEYCLPCPNGVAIPTAMGYPILVSRMSPPTATAFAAKAMETVPLCADCEECLEKCPYNLPIPDMIKEHYAQYERDRKNSGQ